MMKLNEVITLSITQLSSVVLVSSNTWNPIYQCASWQYSLYFKQVLPSCKQPPAFRGKTRLYFLTSSLLFLCFLKDGVTKRQIFVKRRIFTFFSFLTTSNSIIFIPKDDTPQTMQGFLDLTSNFISGMQQAVGVGHNEVSPETNSGVVVLQSVPFTESKVFGSLPPVVQSAPVIPVGEEYFIKKRHIAGEVIIETITDVGDDNESDDAVIIIPPNITPENLDQFTFYEILGLSSFGDSADRVLIKKAHRKAVLLYHPDKMHSQGHSEEECRAIFLRVQEAADTLLDTSKRRSYDSLLDFDESIPTESEAKVAGNAGVEVFLELYEPVFKRNARFALTKPVPSIGSANTPLVHINSFYSYWVKFDSWRDFTNVDREHDPDQAESREHKRWMQKENEKNAKKLKKKEMARILELVTRALAHDPRIIAEKERVRKEKLAQKEEHERKKTQERNEKEETAKRLKEEQEQRAKEEKLQHEKARKQASKSRNTFRKLLRVLAGRGVGEVGGEYGIMTADDCDFVCQSTDATLLTELNEKMGGEAVLLDSGACITAAATEVLTHLRALQQLNEDKKQEVLKQTELRKREHEKSALASSLKKKGANREWTGEEFSVLSKAIRKFPAGSRQRWVTISNFMNDLLKPTVPYEKEECLQASQNAMKIMATLQEQESVQKAPPPPIPPTPLTTSASAAAAAAPSVPVPVPVKPPSKQDGGPNAKSKGTKGAPSSTSAGKESQSNSKSKSQSTSNSKEDASLVWSQEQQKLLESGLKKYPASMDKNERWVAIAGDISGKSKKDCILRFKKLREELQAVKTKK
jgi:DnaJ homolog subfamily C member 2